MKGITCRHYNAREALRVAIYLLGYSKKIGLIGKAKVRCKYNDTLDFPYAIWEYRSFGGYVTWGIVASGHSWYEALSELLALKIVEEQKKEDEK